ncbi:right handed beta helix region domain-containing protein [Penicillium frequentans]|uniref:Right handed beta helix region domain-containing protein n=1 Tax=Penicillium frequentans TaxID=3151616 RepID=A0AAD6CNS2_9EURO|nr:right handed beta helix region domain-containing protein [Penicillium glabrum]
MKAQLGLLAVLLAGSSFASAKSIYVDCSGNGSGNGSQAHPYTSLSLVNDFTFSPGDKLLFKSEVNCTGQLVPQGSGTKEYPITISRYGHGGLPVIDAEGQFNATVYLLNVDYWIVSDLFLTNAAEEESRRQGIDVEATDGRIHAGITIKNLRIDTVAGSTNKRLYSSDYSNSACILLQGTMNYSRYDDVEIYGNNMSNCGGGGIKVRLGQLDNQGKNLRVHDNTIEQVGGDGIVVSYAISPLIDHNVAGDLGYGTYPYSGGNFAGIWVLGCYNAVMRYNIVYGSVMSEIDSEAFDCDWGNTGTCTVEYNYSHDNAGGIFLNCDGCSTSPGGATQIVRYNIFENDCRIYSNGDAPTLWFYNNVVYCPNKDLELHLPPSTNFWNNIVVATENSTLPFGANVDYQTNLYQNMKLPSWLEFQGSPDFVEAGQNSSTLDGLNGYKLRKGSEALQKGTNVDDDGGKDFWGAEISNGKPNIGAYAGRGI